MGLPLTRIPRRAPLRRFAFAFALALGFRLGLFSACSSSVAPPPSASRSSAVGAATTLTTSVSGSAMSETPSGNVIEPAVNWVPISAPSMDTVK